MPSIDVRYARMSTPEEYRAEEEARHKRYVEIGLAHTLASTIACACLVLLLAAIGWANASGHAAVVAWSAFVVIALIACGFALHAWTNWRDAVASERERKRRFPERPQQ